MSQCALLVLPSILAIKSIDGFKLVPRGIRVEQLSIHRATHGVVLVMIKRILLALFLSSANT